MSDHNDSGGEGGWNISVDKGGGVENHCSTLSLSFRTVVIVSLPPLRTTAICVRLCMNA